MENQKKIYFSENPHQYKLFTLRKLLSVSGTIKTKPSKNLEENQENINNPIKIKLINQGGYKGHEFFAMYTNNNYLIFRYLGDNTGIPLVKQLPWFIEPNKSISALCFNPTAQWLVCITNDLSIALLPIYFFMCKSSSGNSQIKSNNPS